MPDESQDISLPVIAAKLKQHAEVLADHAGQLADHGGRIGQLENDNKGIEAHLREQDQKLMALPEIKLAIVGDGGDANIGLVRKMDEVKHDVKSLKTRDAKWSNGFWYVVGAIITAIIGGIAFAVAAYFIHR